MTKSSFETHVTGLVFRVLGAARTCDVIAEGFPGGVKGVPCPTVSRGPLLCLRSVGFPWKLGPEDMVCSVFFL